MSGKSASSVSRRVSGSIFAVLLSLSGIATAGVTYEIPAGTPLLDTEFYSGGPGQEGAVTSVAGRWAYFATYSNDGTQIAFLGLNLYDAGTTGTFQRLYVVDVGDPSSWRQVSETSVELRTPVWSPNDQFVAVDSDRIRVLNGAVNPDFFGSMAISSVTTEVDQNFAVGPTGGLSAGQLGAVAINDDLSLAGDIIPITNFSGIDFLDGRVSADGSLVALLDIVYSVQPDYSLPGYESAQSEIYLFTDISGVIANTSSAPTAYTDPRIRLIRNQAEGGSRVKGLPWITIDNSLVIYAEDFNDEWNYLQDQPDSFIRGDFDVMLTTTLGDAGPAIDGANTSDDLRFAVAGNQLVSSIARGGVRVLFQSQSSLSEPLRIFATTLSVTTTIDGADSNPVTGVVPIDTDGDSIPDDTVTVGDNAVQIDTVDDQPMIIADASGTEIELPEGQVIDFPSGAPQEISITTPIDPVEEAELPPGAPIDAIPIVREFGPTDTLFAPPIAITISYTDAEINNVFEETLTPYLFNTISGIFDIEVPEGDIIERDLVNNTITFQVDHFSTYGLGAASRGVGAPQKPWATYTIMMFLFTMGAFTLRRSAHIRK